MVKLRLLSTYTGYGGAEFILKKVGIDFEVVSYSEIHSGQIKIYEQNWKGHNNLGDITKVKIEDVPECDMITGGFPCQDVSIAGLRDLSKGRTKSVFKLLEIVKIKKPKYVLLENVQGILSMLDGELLREVIRYLKNIGYAVSYKLLFSKDYGTPQNRPRVWIAAERDICHFGYNPFPKKEELKIKVSDLLEKEVDKKYYLTDKQIEYIKYKSKKRNKPLLKRINPQISTTLSTKQAAADCIFIKDKKGLRNLTLTESFRLQGFFKDEININGIPKTTVIFSAGNGWEQNVGSKIVKKMIHKKYYTKK